MGISNNASGLRPGVCTSTTRPTAPYTGQIIFETDTGYLRVWDGSAWDYLSQSQDTTTNIKASDIGAAWTSWTPTWTSSGTAPALGNGTSEGRYTQINKIVIAQGAFIYGSTSTYGTGQYFSSLPVAMRNKDNFSYGFCTLLDASAGYPQYVGVAVPGTTTSNLEWRIGNAQAVWTATVPFTLAASDQFRFTAIYEAA